MLSSRDCRVRQLARMMVGRVNASEATAMRIRNLLRALWQPARPLQPPDNPELARLVGLAEAAYDAMYDARRPKDSYEDADRYFDQAIAEAKRLGRDDEVARLAARRDHVAAVYNSQFRNV
jgi:hypothetical protein